MLMWSAISISRPRAEVGAQRAGGVGQHEDLGAGRLAAPARGCGCCVEVAALVEVRAALERHDGHAADAARARARPACPSTLGRGKPGQVLVAARRWRPPRRRPPRPGRSRAPRRPAAAAPARSTSTSAASRQLTGASGSPGAKESGSSSPSVVRTCEPPRWTGVSGLANSARRWRQPPQGGQMSISLGHHGHGGDLALAGRDQRADRGRLRALALRVGGVLDVGAGVDRAGRRPAARRPP